MNEALVVYRELTSAMLGKPQAGQVWPSYATVNKSTGGGCLLSRGMHPENLCHCSYKADSCLQPPTPPVLLGNCRSWAAS